VHRSDERAWVHTRLTRVADDALFVVSLNDQIQSKAGYKVTDCISIQRNLFQYKHKIYCLSGERTGSQLAHGPPSGEPVRDPRYTVQLGRGSPLHERAWSRPRAARLPSSSPPHATFFSASPPLTLPVPPLPAPQHADAPRCLRPPQRRPPTATATRWSPLSTSPACQLVLFVGRLSGPLQQPRSWAAADQLLRAGFPVPFLASPPVLHLLALPSLPVRVLARPTAVLPPGASSEGVGCWWGDVHVVV